MKCVFQLWKVNWKKDILFKHTLVVCKYINMYMWVIEEWISIKKVGKNAPTPLTQWLNGLEIIFTESSISVQSIFFFSWRSTFYISWLKICAIYPLTSVCPRLIFISNFLFILLLWISFDLFIEKKSSLCFYDDIKHWPRN